jgi:RNA polymerase sigma-70 factor (ECF subfamily)
MDSTAELVHRCTTGDPSAFDGLVREYMNTVLGLAYHYVRNFHTAEDLAQETFIQAYQSIGSLRDGARFKVWLLRIVRNKCIDYIRRNPKHLSMDQDEELQKEVSRKAATQPPSDQPDGFSEEQLFVALDALRADYREIFVMKHVDNLSYKEISELLGMSVSAVGEKLYRVRSMIRERVEASARSSR